MLLLLACTVDPIVTLVSPEEGDRLAAGFSANLQATVRADTDVVITWTVNGSPVDGVESFDGTVASLSTTALSYGEAVIAVEAVDDNGHAGRDTVTVNVFDNLAPTAVFLTPTEGQSLVAGESLLVSAGVDDADGGGEMTLSWSGAAAGAAGAPTFLAGPGTVSFTLVDLAAGANTLGLTVTDRYGAAGSASVNFTVGEADNDLDDDGYDDVALGGDDCDDDNAAIHPGADEWCDGIDNDCDGDIDTGAVTFDVYADNDGDGYGAGTATTDCTVRAGYSLDNTDCNDGNASVSPGASEVCDEANADEDCDGRVDDADGSVTGTSTYYGDVDGDGYGDPGTTSERCEGASTWVTNSSDCDDDEPEAYTGATEVCEDGVDNDCAGGDPLCPIDGSLLLADADFKVEGPGDLALFGRSIDNLGDTDGDGADDLVVGAWGYGTGGTVYLLSGGAIRSGAVTGTTVTAEAADDGLGYAVAACGDTDGDGLGDAVLGAPENGGGKGAVYLWGGAHGSGAASAADDEANGATGDGLGSALDCGHDLDGDGVSDVIAGASGTSVSYIYDAETLTKTAKFTGGSAVALLDDVNGDGLDDALVGAYTADRVYLVYGGTLANITLSSGADVAYSGEASGDEAGAAVAGLGDIDADGYGDFGAGAPENDTNGAAGGAAYLLLGGPSVASASLSTGVRVAGDDGADRAGAALCTPGDVDGDGLADVMVGAYYDDAGGTGAGAAALLYGSVSLVNLDFGDTDAQFVGESDGDSAGEGVGGADVNGDGFADVLVGAPSEQGGGSAAGALYVWFGGGR